MVDGDWALLPGPLAWLQAWVTVHGGSVSIGMVSNPGWTLSISLEGTPLADRRLERRSVSRSDDDWYEVWVERDRLRRRSRSFEGVCGLMNLEELLLQFRLWADDAPRPVTLAEGRRVDMHPPRLGEPPTEPLPPGPDAL